MPLSIEPHARPSSPSPPGERPRLRKLLRLPRRELARAIREEVERNPLLEEASRTLSQERSDAFRHLSSIERYSLLEEEVPPEADGPAEEVMAAEGPVEIDWEDYPDHFLLAPAPLPADPADGAAEVSSLYAHLAAQLGLASLTPEEARVATAIVANLDQAGYFRIEGVEGDPLIAVAAETGVGLEVAASALRKLQRLDPPGVCARDLQECLSIQARALGADKGLVGVLVTHHLADLEARGLREVAAGLGASDDEIRAAAQLLAEMDPKPGLAFHGALEAAVAVDASIHRAGDSWLASVDDPLAALRLSRRYRFALHRRGAAEDRAIRFLSRNLEAATALIDAVRERQRLLLELARTIATRQVRFLERGPAWIRPAPLGQVARSIGEDEARLGDAAFGKLVDTPHGVFPMVDFFRGV
ncbi:MAG TPA: hypothetical protein VN033_14080 [Vulgatibacter sp.]|nr:hypothetical protein [Vulgatibacter sp.]